MGYISDDMADEFEYPDYYDYRTDTGDTPTTQSNCHTSESEASYDHHYPRLIQDPPYASGMDYLIRLEYL